MADTQLRTLFAKITEEQWSRLRGLAFDRKCSVAELVREALNDYLADKPMFTLHQQPGIS